MIGLILAAAVSTCPAIASHHLLLSSLADPRVLVWKSRRDLHAYVDNGSVSVPPEQVAIVAPMTQTVVVQCPKGDGESVGVKIIQGEYKGLYGWVYVDDLS